MIEKTRPDIVSIITPPAQHFEHCRVALEKGCYVFCEKPFMEDLEQADEIIEMAGRTGRHIVVNNEFRYMQIYSRAREFIGKPEFGELRYLIAWHTFRPTSHTEAGWRGRFCRPGGCL
jgi:predicted dehydrogenase